MLIFTTKHFKLFIRLCLATIFLWAFFDKTFGLGFPTSSTTAWVRNGSPTSSFLEKATYGPLHPIFTSLAHHGWVDWTFMLTLLYVGTALATNRTTRFASWLGAGLMLSMWLSMLPPKNNPLVDEHIVYAATLIFLAHD